MINDGNKPKGRDQLSCENSFKQLKLTDFCKMNEPNTLFRFVENNHEIFFDDFLVSELHIIDSEIRNFYYSMTSMVNITQWGAQIQIENTVFDRINICGSIIANKYYSNNNQDLSGITIAGMSRAQKDFIAEINKVSFGFTYYYEYFDIDRHNLKEWYKYNWIRIGKGSKFTNLNHGSPAIKKVNYVSHNTGVQYHGLVLNLDNFQGDVYIENSVFEDN